jgi:hypothetical protein
MAVHVICVVTILLMGMSQPRPRNYQCAFSVKARLPAASGCITGRPPGLLVQRPRHGLVDF